MLIDLCTICTYSKDIYVSILQKETQRCFYSVEQLIE